MSRSISHVGIVSVVAIIIIIAAGGAYLTETMVHSTVSSSSMTSIVTNNSTLTHVGSTSVETNDTTTDILFSTTTSAWISTQSGGLLLRLELNSSRIASGAAIEINVSDYNSSPMELNISKGASWALDGLSTGGCPSLYYPFGIAVFQGRYTSENASQAVPLRIFPVVACPMLVRYITGYLFQPGSDNATVLPGTGEVPMATGVTVSGTYIMTGNQPYQLMAFTPGTYTVAAGDEWGNLAFAYFAAVTPS